MSVNQDDAIQTLEAGQAEIDALLGRLSDEEMTRPRTIGATEWSAKDLLGHLAFWEELAVEAVADWQNQRPLAVADALGKRTDAANAGNQERTAAQSLSEVRERAGRVHRLLLATIRGLSPEEWRTDVLLSGDLPAEPLSELLGGILGMKGRPFGHAFAHVEDLRRYVESR